MIKILLFFLGITTLLFSGNITIAVAANVSYAIPEITKEFNKEYPNIKVKVILGGSGKLTAQIVNGAPYQIFMSADMKYPNHLYKNGFAIDKPSLYAQGSLAYFSCKKQDFSKGMSLTLSSNINKIAVANPKTAPYGIATKQAMENSGLYDKIKDKFVYGDSISQTVSYSLIATDLGFIAKSSLFSINMKQYKKGINWSDVDTALYTPIKQGIVILKKGKNNQDVLSFYHFILSKKAKLVFKKFGYII